MLEEFYPKLFKIKERYYNPQRNSIEHLPGCKFGECTCGLRLDLDGLFYDLTVLIYPDYLKEKGLNVSVFHENSTFKKHFANIYNQIKKPNDPPYDIYLRNREEQLDSLKKLVETVFNPSFLEDNKKKIGVRVDGV